MRLLICFLLLTFSAFAECPSLSGEFRVTFVESGEIIEIQNDSSGCNEKVRLLHITDGKSPYAGKALFDLVFNRIITLTSSTRTGSVVAAVVTVKGQSEAVQLPLIRTGWVGVAPTAPVAWKNAKAGAPRR